MTEEKTKKKDSNEETEDLYPAEEQGILPEESGDDKEAAMEHGDKDEDIYSKEGREKLVEDDEIDPIEAGIMEGASQAGQLGKDALTGEPLMDVEDVIETEIDGKVYRFVNQENAEKFRKNKENQES